MNKDTPKSRPVGRPKSRPPGARYYATWLTAAEIAAVKALVEKMRAKK